jgi:hypothetical protein
MKTMLWKEFRENLKWGALALLALMLADFHALVQMQPSMQGYDDDYTICSTAFLLTTAFGCSTVGIALALVQILPELRRDQWAALLHRPTSRGTIFFGKAIVGLSLYFTAALVALLSCAWYAAVPGHFAIPFVPAMMVPSVSDVFLGAAGYSVALLLGLEHGKWFGRRGVIALSFVGLILQHLNSGWPFAAPIVFTLIYLLAGWDAMQREGENRLSISRGARVLAILLGAEVVVLIPIFFLQFLPSKSVPGSPSSMFEVTPDGHAYIQLGHSQDQNWVSDGVIDTKTGQKIDDKKIDQNQLQFAWLVGPGATRYWQGSYQASPRLGSTYLAESYMPMSKERWFLPLAENYLIGFDKTSRMPAAICDADGFKLPKAATAPRPFAHRLDTNGFYSGAADIHPLNEGNLIHFVNFPERQMSTYDAGEKVYGAAAVEGGYLQDKPTFLAGTLAKGLQLLDANIKPVILLPYPHDPARWTSLQLAANDDGSRIYLVSSGDFVPGALPPVPAFLEEFDRQGHILNSYSTPYPRFSQTAASETLSQRATTLASPFLPVVLGTAAKYDLPQVDSVSIAGYSQWIFPQPVLNVPLADLGIIFGIDLVLAVIAFAWARYARLPASAASLWTLFVLAFGPAGLLAFRLSARWPTAVPCPACGQRRPIEKEECPHCHQPWPAPAASGTEIIDVDVPAAREQVSSF